jgi:methylmalonyl-CoA mutase cobalamin-binding domain/chain
MQKLRDFVVTGDAERALAATEQALDEGADPRAIMDEALIPAMDIVGQQFSLGEIYVPEMLVSALAMKGCLDRLKPSLVATAAGSRGSVVIGSVKGDLHDIGKNIVAMLLEGAGYEVVDLGVDVSPRAFVEAIDLHGPRILALSCLLTTTMPMMPATLTALDQAGARRDVHVLVGGAPVTQAYADAIGADGYASNAASAVEEARRLIAG